MMTVCGRTLNGRLRRAKARSNRLEATHAVAITVARLAVIAEQRQRHARNRLRRKAPRERRLLALRAGEKDALQRSSMQFRADHAVRRAPANVGNAMRNFQRPV